MNTKFLFQFAIAGLVALCLSLTARAEDKVVATVNNLPVSAEEYRLVMSRQAPQVFSYFNQTQGLEDHRGYWSETSGPDGPLAKLREEVAKELVRVKVYQGQAKSRGLLANPDFAAFQTSFTQENARRKAAKQAGQVVYGPPQYDLTTYYYIRLADIVYQVEHAIAAEIAPTVTEAAIKEFYLKNKTEIGDKPLEEVQTAIREALSLQVAREQLAALRAGAIINVIEAELRPLVPRIDEISAN